MKGRSVAVLRATQPQRRRWLTKAEFLARMRRAQADPGLRDDLGGTRRRHHRRSWAYPMSQTPAAGLLDTSVFIATETGRQLEESLIPAEVATSVITLAELTAGVRGKYVGYPGSTTATLRICCRHGNAAGR